MRKGEFLKSEASAKCGKAFLKVAFRKMRKLAAEGRGTLQNMEKLLLVPCFSFEYFGTNSGKKGSYRGFCLCPETDDLISAFFARFLKARFCKRFSKSRFLAKLHLRFLSVRNSSGSSCPKSNCFLRLHSRSRLQHRRLRARNTRCPDLHKNLRQTILHFASFPGSAGFRQ